MENGTIDITDIVEKLKAAWIEFQTALVMSLALSNPYLAWLGLPVIHLVAEFLIKRVMTVSANSEEQVGFFINTALRKSSQAADFSQATDELEALPPTTSNEVYENAEKKRMEAFRNLAMVTR